MSSAPSCASTTSRCALASLAMLACLGMRAWPTRAALPALYSHGGGLTGCDALPHARGANRRPSHCMRAQMDGKTTEVATDWFGKVDSKVKAALTRGYNKVRLPRAACAAHIGATCG